MLVLLFIALLCYTSVTYLINKEWMNAYTRCVLTTMSPLKCNRNDPKSCKQINGHTFGWCLDPEINGPLPGNSHGPIDFKCNRWIWKPRNCPPTRCSHLNPKSRNRKYGWCQTTQTAMVGSECGPKKPNTCPNWVWNPKNCSKKCPVKPQVKPKVKPTETQKPTLTQTDSRDKCKLKCGMMKDGKKVPCPPPGCSDPTCSITCGKLKSGNVPCPPPPCSGGKQCFCKGKWTTQ